MMKKSIESQPKIKCDELIDRLNEILFEANYLESYYAADDFNVFRQRMADFKSSIAKIKCYTRWIVEDLKEIK